MGKLVQIGNIIIRVYANDHLPPHFHILTPDGDALVDIAILEILREARTQGARHRPRMGCKEQGGYRRRVEPDQSPLSNRLRQGNRNGYAAN